MKTIISFFALAFVLTATSAFANAYGNFVPFSAYSAASGSAVHSSAVNVRGFSKKTLTADFSTGSGSGTLIVECAPTASGPWSTCKQSDLASTPAVSVTASGTTTWTDAVAYIRATWTKTSGKIYAWINWQED